MKLLFATAVVLLFAASPALASPILLAFEGPSSYASIAEYYNGGTDSDGVAGPNLGVSFGLDDLGLQNDILGPYFSNTPSPLGVMVPVGPDTALNFAAGFMNLSFYYSASDDVLGGVQVWSGLNGAGTLLASFDLVKNSEADGIDRFGQWDLVSSGYLGNAHSATFTNMVGLGGIDNIGIAPAPEPATWYLLVVGLAGLLPLRRQFSRSRESL